MWLILFSELNFDLNLIPVCLSTPRAWLFFWSKFWYIVALAEIVSKDLNFFFLQTQISGSQQRRTGRRTRSYFRQISSTAKPEAEVHGAHEEVQGRGHRSSWTGRTRSRTFGGGGRSSGHWLLGNNTIWFLFSRHSSMMFKKIKSRYISNNILVIANKNVDLKAKCLCR